MAATLIHIKSRMLLPRPDPTQEDPEEDPREALVRRLLEHQRYRQAAELLHERETLREAQWQRPDGRVAPIAGRGVRAGARGRSLQPDRRVQVGARARQAAAEGRAAGRADPDRDADRAAARAAVGDRGVRVRGPVRRRVVEGRPDRDVPRAARDDSPEGHPGVPGRLVRADPDLQDEEGSGSRQSAAGSRQSAVQDAATGADLAAGRDDAAEDEAGRGAPGRREHDDADERDSAASRQPTPAPAPRPTTGRRARPPTCRSARRSPRPARRGRTRRAEPAAEVQDRHACPRS